jgi:hypothetical protein
MSGCTSSQRRPPSSRSGKSFDDINLQEIENRIREIKIYKKVLVDKRNVLN